MVWWEALILGLVQGLTEFLPVSSSGHLVLGAHVLGLQPGGDVVFEVFVHFGTALSILTVYRADVLHLIRETLGSLVDPTRIRQHYRERERFRTAVWILLTLIPTGAAYVLFRDPIEAAFASPRLASGMLLLTGAMLLATVLKKNTKGRHWFDSRSGDRCCAGPGDDPGYLPLRLDHLHGHVSGRGA